MINNTFRGDKNHQLWLIKDTFHDKSQLIISIVSQLIMIISQSVMIRITINEDKIHEETTFRMTTITKKKGSYTIVILSIHKGLNPLPHRIRTLLAEFFFSSSPFFQGYRGMCQGGGREEEKRDIKHV